MVPIRAALLLLACASLSLVLLSTAPAPLAPLAPDEAARAEHGFDASQHALHTFQADIVQTLVMQGLDRPIVSRGRLFYQAPDKFLLRFTDPAGEWILSDGKTLSIQKKGQPLLRRDLNPGLDAAKSGPGAASLFDFFHSDSARWHRDFDVKLARDGGVLEVSLTPWRTPGAARQGFDGVVTRLQLPDYAPLSITVLAGDNRIGYASSHPRRNGPVDPSLFTPPAP